MARPSNRETILDAFESILIAHGVTEATLEVIADSAGVSKGGLLYHFGSKDELFTAFGERLARRVDDATGLAPTDPVEVIRWYLAPDPADDHGAALWRSTLAALHGADAGLMGAIRAAFARHARPLEILEPTLAAQVRLVGDGILLHALLGVEPRPQLEAIIDDLMARARGGPG
jgi:AcrR family transcriptional regulator